MANSVAIANQIIDVRLHWDFEEGAEKVDLDCSAILFDECGFVVDAAFYNNLGAADGSVKHSGEKNTSLPDGANEQITLELPRIPDNIHAIVLLVNAFCGSTLAKLETAFVSLNTTSTGNQGSGTKLHEMSVCGGAKGAFRDTGVVLGLLRRKKGAAWGWEEEGKSCGGRNFLESLKAVQAVVDARIEPGVVAERGNRVLNTTKTFFMKKGNVAEIPEEIANGGGLFIGLGWTCGKKIDLDASVIAMKENGHVEGITCFKNLTGVPGTRHHGDNLTGAGDGDDEVIDLHLDLVPKRVKSLFVVVNIYTKWASFQDVSDAYVRLVSRPGGGKQGAGDKKGDHVLNNYKLDGTIKNRGVVFLRIFRRPLNMGWALEALGTGCEGQKADRKSVV